MAGHLLILLVSSIFVDNYLLSRFLGECPFLGVSKKVETAMGMSVAVIFVMTMTGVISYVVQTYILVPLKLEYLQIIAFIVIIATLVQFTEMVIKKASPTLYQALGIYLPLITTNCAVLGVALLNVQMGYNLIDSIVYSFGSAVGFAFALVSYAGIRERLAFAPIPKTLEGFPSALIGAGLLSLAFLGFRGLV
jgi:electron transport complex protein RnfA